MNNQRLASLRAKKGYHILPIRPGQMLEIHETVGEGNNIRTWKFKGLVIKVKKPNHIDGTFTIRGKAAGHTIEKIYPLSFPKFEKVLLLDVYKIRRAKLYYIREKIGKDARMKSISTAEDRGVDLLAVSKEEAAALLAAAQELEKEEVKVEDEVKEEEVAGLAEELPVESAGEQSDEQDTDTTEVAPQEEASDEDESETPTEDADKEE